MGVFIIIVGLVAIGWLYSIGGGIAIAIGIIALIALLWSIASGVSRKNSEFAGVTKTILANRGFSTDLVVSTPNGGSVLMDFKKEEILFTNPVKQKRVFISYKDMIDVELIVAGLAPVSANMSGALIGGVLAGTTGAIVGSASGKKEKCDDISIKILRSDKSNALSVIKLIDMPVDRDGIVYKNAIESAQKIFSTLQAIVHEKKGKPASFNTATNGDSSEDLRKYEQLLDDGIITQEDFNAKKKQVLGI